MAGLARARKNASGAVASGITIGLSGISTRLLPNSLAARSNSLAALRFPLSANLVPRARAHLRSAGSKCHLSKCLSARLSAIRHKQSTRTRSRIPPATQATHIASPRVPYLTSPHPPPRCVPCVGSVFGDLLLKRDMIELKVQGFFFSLQKLNAVAGLKIKLNDHVFICPYICL